MPSGMLRKVMSSGMLNLERLLAPTSTEDFFARYWQREPFHLIRQDEHIYNALLSARDAEELIGAALRHDRALVELLGAANLTGTEEAVRVERLEQLVSLRERGATVRVYQVEQLRESVRQLCLELEQTFSFPVRANLYLTPASAQGAQRHYDTHDVLVLQIAGRKTWSLYPPVFPLPLTHLPPLPFEERTGALRYRRGGPRKGRARTGDAEAPARTVTLEAGDLLYLPRGHVHEARTATDASIHLTLGLHVLTWLDLVSVALGQVAQRDERFRRALPVGFANEAGNCAGFVGEFSVLLQALVEQAGFRQAFDETAESFLVSRTETADTTSNADMTSNADTTPNAGRTSNVETNTDGDTNADGDDGASEEAARSLQPDTLLERRPGLLCRLVPAGALVGLATARGVLWMPESFADALRFIARTLRLRPRDIPGLSEHSQLALARRLLSDRLLRLAPEPSAHDERTPAD